MSAAQQLLPLSVDAPPRVLPRSPAYPRLRFMGSKYRVVPRLTEIFATLEFETVLDGFSGSGVVGYALKSLGKTVTSTDFLEFPATVAKALIENSDVTLDAEDIERLLSPNADGRDFIRRTFTGRYFPDEDHDFLDAAWSHLEEMSVYKRALALSALCLAAARKQPRGVFTITDFRYDDGRRNLRAPLRELFLRAVDDYNGAVFSNGKSNSAYRSDIFSVDPNKFDLVYFDPPYVPPRDDNDYIKRYHFLEGLCTYWRGQKIMEHTNSKKLEKRFTPFAYKRTIRQAFLDLFARFQASTIVLSYSSNSYPDAQEIHDLLKRFKRKVTLHEIPHWYSFGTHAAAERRNVNEYVFVAT